MQRRVNKKNKAFKISLAPPSQKAKYIFRYIVFSAKTMQQGILFLTLTKAEIRFMLALTALAMIGGCILQEFSTNTYPLHFSYTSMEIARCYPAPHSSRSWTACSPAWRSIVPSLLPVGRFQCLPTIGRPTTVPPRRTQRTSPSG